MTRWHSLYLSCDSTNEINRLIDNFFDALDYEPYRPFGTLPGMSYPQTIKLFIAPPEDDWTRILVDDATNLEELSILLEAFSYEFDCLSVRLEGKISTIEPCHEGTIIAVEDWAQAHLRDKSTSLGKLLSAKQFNLPPISQGTVGDVSLDQLPEDVQAMARQVDTKDADNMFEKLSKRLVKTIGSRDAGAIISQQPDWDSQGGQYIRTLMQHLTIPDGWRTPDFATVRSAYTIWSQHDPDTKDDALDVPFINMYMPCYGGKFESDF